MRNSRIKYGTNSAAFIIVVLAILAAINFLSYRHLWRVDLTETKDFTISKSTRDILASLDDVVDIKLYFSKKLPPDLIGLKRQISDIIDEYRAYSHGKIKARFIDPEDDPKEEERARFLGIPQVRVNVFEKDQAQLMNAYLGIAILHGDKKETIPVVQSTRNLEYDLTSAILKVTSEEEKVVGFLTGHGELDPYSEERSPDGASLLRAELDKQYRTKRVEITSGKPIDESIDTLLILGSDKLDEPTKFEIDQFIMKGGKVIFAIDPANIDYGLYAQPSDTGLNDMLEHYGVKVESNMILDRFNENASFSSGFITYSLPYPYWVKVIKSGFNQNHSITSDLESIVMQWASSVHPREGLENVTAEVLASSSPNSWSVRGPFNLDPNQRWAETIKETKSYPLAVALSGKFTSFYADKEIPKPESDDSNNDAERTEEREVIKSCEKETQIIVMGTSKIAENSSLAQFRGNAVFILNCVDWLTLGDQLIGIRSHGVTDRPLKEISDSQRNAIKWLSTFGIALLVAVVGVVRFWWRRVHVKTGGVV